MSPAHAGLRAANRSAPPPEWPGAAEHGPAPAATCQGGLSATRAAPARPPFRSAAMSPAHADLRAANREPPAARAAGRGGKRPRDAENLSERVVRYASAPGPAAFQQSWR